jgi:hypothetical protein
MLIAIAALALAYASLLVTQKMVMTAIAIATKKMEMK